MSYFRLARNRKIFTLSIRLLGAGVHDARLAAECATPWAFSVSGSTRFDAPAPSSAVSVRRQRLTRRR